MTLLEQSIARLRAAVVNATHLAPPRPGEVVFVRVRLEDLARLFDGVDNVGESLIVSSAERWGEPSALDLREKFAP